MPYRPAPPRFAALGLAGLVATTLTSQMVLLVAALADLPYAIRAQARLAEYLGTILRDLLLGPVLAGFFGLVGAMIFLGVTFFLVAGSQRRLAYATAGASAGLIHSLCGLLLRGVDVRAAEAAGWGGPLEFVAAWGGFFLTGSPRMEVVAATFPATAIAGYLAGLLYARIVLIGRPVS